MRRRPCRVILTKVLSREVGGDLLEVVGLLDGEVVSDERAPDGMEHIIHLACDQCARWKCDRTGIPRDGEDKHWEEWTSRDGMR